MPNQPTWLNQMLAERLLKRIDRPGVAQPRMADGMVTRLEQMTLPQPLVEELEDRWQSTLELYDESAPLVLAQPVPSEVVPPAESVMRKPRRKVAVAKPLPQNEAENRQPALAFGVKNQVAKNRAADSKATENRAAKETSSSSSKVPRHHASNAKLSTRALAPQTPSSQAGQTKEPAKRQQRDSLANQPLAGVDPSASANLGADKQPPERAATVAVPSPEDALSALPLAQSKETLSKEAGKPNQQLPSSPRTVVQASRRATSADGSSASSSTAVSLPVVQPAPTMAQTFSAETVSSQQAWPANQPASSPSIERVKPKGGSKPAPKRAVVTPSPAAVGDPKQPAQSAAASGPLPVSVAGATGVTGISAAPSLPSFSGATAGIIQRQPQGNLPLAAAKVAPLSARTTQARTTPAQASPANAPAKPKVTPARSSGPAASSGSSSNIIQRAPASDAAVDAGDGSSAAMNIEEIVEEVQRRFMRQVAIEGERRGATSWR